jgi:peptide/nickel transport system ATP-binding protein
MALLEVKQHSLFFHADEHTYNILDRISFTVEKGEILGIVGESGCGKSMLGNSIMGLYPPNVARKEGSILYEGKDLLELTAKQRERYRGERVSMIFQNPNTSLNPVITIGPTGRCIRFVSASTERGDEAASRDRHGPILRPRVDCS